MFGMVVLGFGGVGFMAVSSSLFGGARFWI